MVCPTLKPCLQLWYVMSRYPLRTVYIHRVRVCMTGVGKNKTELQFVFALSVQKVDLLKPSFMVI